MTGRVVTFGELLLRFTPRNGRRFLEHDELDVFVGGAEANVAVALARWGVPVSYTTVLPDENALARAALARLAERGVDTSRVAFGSGRLGLYFVECGVDGRPATVVYDREPSALSITASDALDWGAILEGATWFHATGITPALGSSAADLTLAGIREAKKRGLTISFDVNHRPNLWKWGKAPWAVLPELIDEVGVLVANEDHLRLVTGLDGNSLQDLAERTFERFPSLEYVALTVRDGVEWSAAIADRRKFLSTRRHSIPMAIGRIGAGDAFAAGLIYGLRALDGLTASLKFAEGACVLKHSTPGDFCTSDVADVQAAIKADQV